MKKAISYLYREILLKVNENLTKYYSDEYKEEERAREAIDIFRLGFIEANLEDVENFNETKCQELYKSTNYYSWIGEADIIREIVNEFRGSGEKIDNKIEQYRYFCSQEVAKLITGLNDLYLAWTYYFGGGKYAQPESVEWIEGCYLLRCKEVEEVKIVKIYEKVEK